MTKRLGKAAKVLTDTQVRTLLRFAETKTSYPERNRVVVLLSFKAGLRAKEIAMVRWSMVTDAESVLVDAISLPNTARKRKSGGRVIPIHPQLKTALVALYEHETQKERLTPNGFLVVLKKGAESVDARSNSVLFLFKSWYQTLGFTGASSHSGRRTFITKAARKVSEVGGSLRDVQRLAGHSSIVITQRYVDTDSDAQRKLIDKL